MTLSPGSRLGLYEILSSLGAGGMGEVYRAVPFRPASPPAKSPSGFDVEKPVEVLVDFLCDDR